MQLANLTREELRDQALNSFASFCIIMQDDGWFDPVHELLCNWFQKQIEKAESLLASNPHAIYDVKLQITMPRGSLKSTIITKYGPVWITLRQYYRFDNQGVRSLIVTNTATNAKKKLRDIRGLHDAQDTFKALFPEVLPGRLNRWTDEGAEISRNVSFPEATYECAGTKTKLTGRHYNIIVEDDTTAPDEDEMKVNLTVPNRDTLERAIGFHKASTPLFVPKGLRISIIVTTRWAADDLVDYVRQNESYLSFDMPALDEETGEPLFSMFYNKEALQSIKEKIGPYMFSCLYLNKPLDASLRTFSADHIHYIDEVNVPKTGYVSIAIDPAASKKDDACETSITVVQHVEKLDKQYQYWWEDLNGHFSFEEQTVKPIELAIKYEDMGYEVAGILVETVAYQASLAYLLEQEMIRVQRFFPIIPFRSGKDKKIRIEGMQPLFFRDRVFFVRGSLSSQVESQLTQFPNGRLVDTIDSFSMHSAMYDYDRNPEADKPAPAVVSEFDFYKILEENRRRGKQYAGALSSGLAGVYDSFSSGMSSGLTMTVNGGYYGL